MCGSPLVSRSLSALSVPSPHTENEAGVIQLLGHADWDVMHGNHHQHHEHHTKCYFLQRLEVFSVSQPPGSCSFSPGQISSPSPISTHQRRLQSHQAMAQPRAASRGIDGASTEHLLLLERQPLMLAIRPVRGNASPSPLRQLGHILNIDISPSQPQASSPTSTARVSEYWHNGLHPKYELEEASSLPNRAHSNDDANLCWVTGEKRK
ncbi:hypothetical protein HDV57DRAFT_410875 [Trichoderma longibrachiatum]